MVTFVSTRLSVKIKRSKRTRTPCSVEPTATHQPSARTRYGTCGSTYDHRPSNHMAFLPDETLALVELEGMVPRVADQLHARRVSRAKEPVGDRLTATVMHEVISILGGEEDDILPARRVDMSFRSSGQLSYRKDTPMFSFSCCLYTSGRSAELLFGVGNPSRAHHQHFRIAGDIKVEIKGLSA